MKEKVLKAIEMYESFTNEIEFAMKEIKALIQWSWTSKDLGIIDGDTHTEIYGRAIDALVKLEFKM